MFYIINNIYIIINIFLELIILFLKFLWTYVKIFFQFQSWHPIKIIITPTRNIEIKLMENKQEYPEIFQEK